MMFIYHALQIAYFALGVWLLWIARERPAMFLMLAAAIAFAYLVPGGV